MHVSMFSLLIRCDLTMEFVCASIHKSTLSTSPPPVWCSHLSAIRGRTLVPLPPCRAGCLYYHNRAATHRPCAVVVVVAVTPEKSPGLVIAGHWGHIGCCSMQMLSVVAAVAGGAAWYTTAAAMASAYRAVLPNVEAISSLIHIWALLCWRMLVEK